MTMQRVADPAVAQRLLRKVEESSEEQGAETPGLAITTPPGLEFPLGGWYQRDDGSFATTFEVRELTGRDEEYIGKARDAPKMLIAILERGLVSVGGEKADADVRDSLLAGDWETALLAIRIVTFGPEYDHALVCDNCGWSGEVEIDLGKIPITKVDQDERSFEVVGRHGTKYSVSPPYGAVQRQIMAGAMSDTVAEMNTMMLKDCVRSIGNLPVLSKGDVMDISIADRRVLLREIDKRRAGPDLAGVTTRCPECGEEQKAPISLVLLFQG